MTFGPVVNDEGGDRNGVQNKVKNKGEIDRDGKKEGGNESDRAEEGWCRIAQSSCDGCGVPVDYCWVWISWVRGTHLWPRCHPRCRNTSIQTIG